MPDEIVFTFRTTHNAIGGEKALLAAGVGVRVMSRPSALGDGCGICLRVGEGEYGAAVTVLADAGTEVEAAFLRKAEGGKSVYERISDSSDR